MNGSPVGPRTVRTLVARLLTALALAGVSRGAAQADDVAGVPAPIVRVNLRAGDVTVRSWDRPTVDVSGAPALAVTHRVLHDAEERDRPILIPNAQAVTRSGPVELSAETFVVSSVPAGPRDLVTIRSTPATVPGPITVLVPADSAFVFVHVGMGNVDVHDYRGGTFVGFVGRGRLALDGVGGTVFAQTNRGPLTIVNSTLDRVRARSLAGNVTFERCTVRQVEATSVAGSVVYDGGSFSPGLARFESTRGNVAVGVTGGAQLGARSSTGHVFTNFSATAHLDGRSDEANATVGGGGPVVTATSGSGNVYLYDGSLRSRPALPGNWRQPTLVLERPGRDARRDDGGARVRRVRAGTQTRRAGGERAARQSGPMPTRGELPRAAGSP